MNEIATIPCRVPSGKAASLCIDREDGRYVLSRREGDEISTRQTFATKRDLQSFLARPTCSRDEDALALVLLETRFFDHADIPNALTTLYSDYPVGLILIGRAAVLLHDGQLFRAGTSQALPYLQCYVSSEQFDLMCERELVMVTRGFDWYEMSRDLSDTMLYVNGVPLKIAYSDVEQRSSLIAGIRVAAKEHLLALTINETMIRLGPEWSLNVEVRKDLVALVLRMNYPDAVLLWSVLNEDQLTFLRAIGKDATIFEEMFTMYPGAASELQHRFNQRIIQFENLIDYVGEKYGYESRNRVVSPSTDVKFGGTIPLDRNQNRLPVVASNAVFDDPVTTIRALCQAVGVRFRYSEGEIPSVVVTEGTGNMRAFDLRNRPLYVVDREQFMTKTPQEEALRVLEVVAYSFGDALVERCIHGLLE